MLSTVDQKVLALAWMLEKEVGGAASLRTAPLPRTANSGRRRVASAEPAVTAAPESAPAAEQAAKPVFSTAFSTMGSAQVRIQIVSASAASPSHGTAAANLMASLPPAPSGSDTAGQDGNVGEEGEEEVEDVMDDLPCRVHERLFIGSLDAASNFAALRESGITHVLTVAKELTTPLPAEFTHMHVPVADSLTEDNDLGEWLGRGG